MYKELIVGILRYAFPAWNICLPHLQKSKLATVHCMSLFRFTRSNRTASLYEAVLVLAGGITSDLLLREESYRFKIKGEHLPDLPLYLQVTTPKGVMQQKYFPFSLRPERTWVLLDYGVSQILTRHGSFHAKLYTERTSIHSANLWVMGDCQAPCTGM